MRYYDPGDAPANVPQDPPPVYDIPAWTPPPSYYEPPPPAYEPPPVNYGWGSATNANDLNTIPGNTLTYDVPGSYVDPSPPYEDPKYYTPPQDSAVYTPTNPGWGGNPDYAVPDVPYEPVQANPVPPSWNHDVPGTAENPSPPYTDPSGSGSTPPGTPPPVDVTSPTTPYVPRNPGTPGTPGHWDIYDFMKDLDLDWEVVAQMGIGKEDVGNAENKFQLALRKLFIDTGGDYSKIPEQFRQYIDEPTIEAAKNNKFSLMAQNALTLRRTLKGQRARMAAQGREISGANTEMTRRQLLDKELADINAYRSFEGGALEGLGSVLNARSQATKDLARVRGTAADRRALEHPATWIEGTPEIPASDGYYDYGGYVPEGPGAPPPLTDINGNPYTPAGTLFDPTPALDAARLRRMEDLGIW